MKRGGFRTLKVTPEGIIRLLGAMSAGDAIRLVCPGLPAGLGVGSTRLNEQTGELEIEVFHHDWPDQVGIDEGDTDEIRLLWQSQRDHEGYGAPMTLDFRRP